MIVKYAIILKIRMLVNDIFSAEAVAIVILLARDTIVVGLSITEKRYL